MRDALRSQPPDECPYGEPPAIEIKSETEWNINGKPKNPTNAPCRLIVRNPDACGPCKLNPVNQPRPKKISPLLAHVLKLSEMQRAGATFHYTDLTMSEWDALATLNNERNKYQEQQWQTKSSSK